jgi:hypothetical protein
MLATVRSEQTTRLRVLIHATTWEKMLSHLPSGPLGHSLLRGPCLLRRLALLRAPSSAFLLS